MTRNRLRNILQNLHFTDKETAEKSDKAYKMCIVINDLNKAFEDVMSDAAAKGISMSLIFILAKRKK